MLGSKVTLRKKNSRYVKSGQHIGHHFPSNTLGHFQSSSVPTFPLKQRGMKGRKGQSGKWGSKHYELSTQTMPSATAFGLSCSSASLFWPRPELCHLFSFLHGRSMYIQVIYVRTNGHICVCLFIIEVFFFFFFFIIWKSKDQSHSKPPGSLPVLSEGSRRKFPREAVAESDTTEWLRWTELERL